MKPHPRLNTLRPDKFHAYVIWNDGTGMPFRNWGNEQAFKTFLIDTRKTSAKVIFTVKKLK